ncbi:MAG: nucleotidyltransferase [Chloroflexi bacterium HGW-Chloroflexi-2]|jgi:predicted nucleotidyltransferase|nr:MAG: nucleotidyltransferase [Chloroflexi bacterium HGW-Chloroflexi-2]
MNLNSISLLLHKHQSDLDQFAVKSLAVFGSVARGEATDRSDIDLLVEFNQPIGLFEFIRLKYYLETLIGSKVDLVTPDALHPALRDSILNEAVNVT